MNFYKRAISILLVLPLLCGCTASPPDEPPLPSSTSAVQEDEALIFRDIAGQSVSLSSDYLRGFLLSYTQGWTPGQDGYLRLERDTTSGDITIGEASSQYNIFRQKDSSIDSVCAQSNYSLFCESEIPGILQVEEHAILFFPYENASFPFFLLHPAEDQERKRYADWCTVPQEDGPSLKIQPIGIQFSEADKETILSCLENPDTGSCHWYDAHLRFSVVSISGYSHSEQEEIFATRAFGYLDDEGAASVNSEIFLTELLGVNFMYWIFPGIL